MLNSPVGRPLSGHARPSRVRRHLAAFALALMVTMVVPSGAGWAHGTESDQAAVLVEQALALIANEAGVDRVAERIHDATEAPDQMGVDAAKVHTALEIVERPGAGATELEQARSALLESIGGQLPSRPTAGPAVGTETGTSEILGEFRPARGIRNGGDVAMLVISVVVLGGGLFLARRWRPPHTIRELEHRGHGRAR